MFIVKQNINGKDYYYLRKSIREGDKVISKHVAYLGGDRGEAEEKFEKIKKGELNIESLKQEKENRENERGFKEEFSDNKISIEELANFCKEKGFVFRSSDIYGGIAGFWDFGPLGIELFNNIKRDWWNWFVVGRDDMVGIEASVISHPRTWKASGHLESFSDVAVICKECKKATKLDKSEVGKVNCECGGNYEVQGEFSLMFKTKVGALDADDAYLRGETAQGMFMDFKLVQQTSRMKLPFGIAQIGRCFRNEIAPRDFLFRSREFHIGEFEFFISPDEEKCELFDEFHKEVRVRLLDEETQISMGEESPLTNHPSLKEVSIGEMVKEGKLGEWHGYWLSEQVMWLQNLGLNEIKIREHTKDELSHYSSATFDIDYEYVFGSKEIAGNANRGQYDLKQHEKESKQSMEIFDEKNKKKVVPRVIEPTFGMERVFLAVLTKAYGYSKKRDYVVLKIPPKLAPTKAAVFPIIKKPEYEQIAWEIVRDLRKEWNVTYDRGGSIGRRYARNDEIGTPFCITIDDKSIEDKSVTVRERDTTKQIRIKIDDLKSVLRKLIENEVNFEDSGKKTETRSK
jgi:glycyl-tRNA synthetase